MNSITNGKFTAAALLAFALGFLGGCGGITLPTPTTDAGTTNTGSCTSDTNCATGLVCHPVLKQCIAACTSSADCSTSICKRYDGTAGSTYAGGFCQCTADSQCNGDAGTGKVCSTLTLRCESKCTSTSCPTGYACETASGQCKVPVDAGTQDAGMDAGVTDAGVSCSTTHAQPDVCGYGNACNKVMQCDPATNDVGCANIAQAITKGNYTAWNPATSNGPVIYVVVDEAVDVAADCGGGAAPFTVTVYGYAGTSLFPQTKTGLPGFWYFDANGNKTDIPLSLLKPSNYLPSTDGKTMSAKFTLCGATGARSLAAGFAFTGGNGYCATQTN